jgi:ATP-binding protein involved in chromosome partitioning
MLHRAIEQFLTDVFWGDLDVLLLDLPPGTGDVAISVGQLLPDSELLIVTTPQHAAAQVAERSGALATSTKQRIAGVIENMSWMVMPDGSRNAIFGEGGGRQVAERLSTRLEAAGLQAHVPLLGQIPLDPVVREGADAGTPAVLSHPDSPGPAALRTIADSLAQRRQSLLGRNLGLSPLD